MTTLFVVIGLVIHYAISAFLGALIANIGFNFPPLGDIDDTDKAFCIFCVFLWPAFLAAALIASIAYYVSRTAEAVADRIKIQKEKRSNKSDGH